MYNTKFICTYNYYDPSLCVPFNVNMDNIDQDDISDLEDVCEVLYRAELLQVFNLTEYNDDVIHNTLDMLYEKMSIYEPFKNIIEKATEQMGFVVIFSYQYFYLTHICVAEFLEKGEITDGNLNLLEKALQ